MAVKVGDVRRLDLQSDFYKLPYEVIEDLGGSVFKVRYLEDDEATKAEILADKYGGQRELDFRAEHMYGQEREMRFVSREEWARAF